MSLLLRWLAISALVVLAYALIPVHFNADVFSLLPKGSPTVAGLQRYQQSFGASEAVILALESEQPEILESVLPEIAQRMQQKALAKELVWQSPFGEDPQAMGELLAYLWLNQDPAAVEQLQQRLQGQNVELQLQQTLERIATSFNAGEVAHLANDPLDLTRVAEKLGSASQSNPFASEDGKLRIMYLGYPGSASHYWAYQSWLKTIEAELLQLRAEGLIPDSVSIGKTGNPVFVTEFGQQLLRDLSLAAIGTLLVVLLLFWWAHRQWRSLFWLSGALGLTLAITIVSGALVFTELSAVSLGFAALLMGLAVDYGLIVYQEVRCHPEHSVARLRRNISASILWAACTTAGAFLMLTRSSLPGLTQLGSLVAIGIVVAALVILYLFLPAVAAKPGEPVSTAQSNPLPSRLKALFTSAGLVIFAGLTVLLKPPAIETDVAKLQFNENSAQAVHDRIQHALAREDATLWLIFEGTSPAEAAKALQQAEALLSSASNSMPLRPSLPGDLWPKPENQDNNLRPLQAIAGQQKTLEQQVLQAGFTADSLTLSKAMFSAWQGFRADQTVWPQSPSNNWLVSQFASEHQGHWYGLGKLGIAGDVEKAQLQALAESLNEIAGVSLVGWSLLADELGNTMAEDAKNVLLPMVVMLSLLLAATFRHWADVSLSFVCLAFSLLVLSAAMALLDWRWNIMNLTAVPLLLGAGVDYSIHIQLALKRHGGNLNKVFQSVGRAILLCGASTTVAFASLGLGSNAGIASLGKVAALGIAITALSAVFLLPHWWLLLRAKREDIHEST